jgi:DNA-binding protein YbaB
MSDYREMWEQLKKMEEEARVTGEAVVGIVVVRPPPECKSIKILKRLVELDDKDQA